MNPEEFTILEQVPSVVLLNVGGQLFVTSRDTLLKVPDSLLCRMFQGDVPVTKVKQTDNVYFVDRDPRHFHQILNYMRDGECVMADSVADRREVLAEARHYQLHGLVSDLETSLRSFSATARSFNFKHLVIQHHASTGNLDSCLTTLLDFVRLKLVCVTPVTEVFDDSKLAIYWLSPALPPANPTKITFRYRGDKDAHDLGMAITDDDAAFTHWSRLWNIWHNKQLLTTLRELALHHGLKIGFHAKVETFKADNQLDVVWKMYRVRSLLLSVSAVQ